jgi:hypothetical protein
VMTSSESNMLFNRASSAFRLMLATSWLAPDPWRDHQNRAIGAALHSSPDWGEYLRLVEWHRTPALSWEALKRIPEANLPTAVMQELQQRSSASRIRVVRLASLLIQLLKDFNQTGIRTIPLKGPFLSLELYGDLALRHSRDIDIMVTLSDMSSAHLRLERMGWRAYFDEQRAGTILDREIAGAGTGIVETWELSGVFSPRHTQKLLRVGHHRVYWHPVHRSLLELHWRTQRESPDRTAGQWTRSTARLWNGTDYWALSPVDVALHLCEHGSGHNWSRAKWLGDLARMYTVNYVDWYEAYRTACAAGMENSLLQCLLLLQDLYGLPVPEALDEAAGSQLARLLYRASAWVLDSPGLRPGRLLERLRMAVNRLRYQRVLRPHKSWRLTFTEVAYCGPDFELLRLPDRLFWLYVPLRPILWAWRWLGQTALKPHGEAAKPR